MTRADQPGSAGGLRQLRHDLLNPLNVLLGATSALQESVLDDAQHGWVRMLRSTARRLQDIIDRLEEYQGNSPSAYNEGRARLADLCSIAAARIGKPFDRHALVSTIERVAGPGQLRILLVDDSKELATLVGAYLQHTPWDLDVVETGERAVAQATGESYDVVLMDIDLPGVDGATAAHAIRAADLARGVSPTPVIAMTAFDTPELTAFAAGETGATPPSAEHVTIDDPEIAPLIPSFLTNRRAEVPMYRAALEAREFARIQSTAHKMKGTGRGYGFDLISRIGDDLERAAHEQDTQMMQRLIDELDGYLARVSVTS